MSQYKHPLQVSLNRVAENRIADAFALTGKALPASVTAINGAIVTIKFEVESGMNLPIVTIPLFGSEYVRLPVKVGDKGVVFPMDTSIGAISGLGTQTAFLGYPPNLASVVFFPVGNTAWSSVDPAAVTLYGSNGVVMRDTASNSIITLTPTSIVMQGKNSVQLKQGTNTVTIDATGVVISAGATTASFLSSGVWSISGASSFGSVAGEPVHSGNLNTMYTVFNSLITWLNGHTHTSGGAGLSTSSPITPYSGGNIIG